MPRASEKESVRAQALKAHAAFYRGNVREASYLIQGLRGAQETVAQQAASLNTLGMIDLALGEYAAARQDFEEASDIALEYGRALTSHIDDNMAFLEASLGHYETALTQTQWLLEDCASLDPTMLCSVLMHRGTAQEMGWSYSGSGRDLPHRARLVGAEETPILPTTAGRISHWLRVS